MRSMRSLHLQKSKNSISSSATFERFVPIGGGVSSGAPLVRLAGRTPAGPLPPFRPRTQLDKIGRRAPSPQRTISSCKLRAATLLSGASEDLGCWNLRRVHENESFTLNADGVPDPGAVGAPGGRGLNGFTRVCILLSKHALISTRALKSFACDAVGEINQTRKAL